MRRVSVLFTVAIVVGMAGCGGAAESYTLAVQGTAGGAVTVDNATVSGKTVLAYNRSTVASLNATPGANYRFMRWIGSVDTVANTTAAVSTITMNGDYNVTALFEVNFMVAAGIFHTVGLKSDGTVVAVGFFDITPVLGENLTEWLDVGKWTDIVQVVAGSFCTTTARGRTQQC